ncbi:MAG: helix-turn-helix transcriptional regulator [Leptolyngbyaceae cyanobacterium bins.302]|nr:helix-turn-helix transcriptional regulator [Leptolyngbyaceae cyanobacterium bins.302]
MPQQSPQPEIPLQPVTRMSQGESDLPNSATSSVEVAYTTWDVEVATIDLTTEQSGTSSQWATVARSILTPDYLATLIDILRSQSSLPELVTAQLLQHLLKIYRHKVEVMVQEEGIDAIDTSLPHFKVITNRKQGTKRLELVFDNDRIKDYLQNSLSEFFTHTGIWKEFAKAVGANLVVWIATDLDSIKELKSDQPGQEEILIQTVRNHLQDLSHSLIVERSEVLAQLHCLDIANKITDGFNLSNCTLQDIEKLLGLKQRPPATTETSLDLDPIAVLPTSIPIASSIRAQLRPDLWQQGENQTAVFHYRSKTNPSNYIEHYITNPGDIEMLPWEAAEQIINKFGFDTVKLQLIFAARTMEENEPWNSTFTLKASDIVQLLGWDKNHNTSMAEKRSAVASTAYALSCLLVKSVWIEGRGRRKVDASTPIGRMWDVLIDLHGQFDWVTGKIEKPEEVYITVSPGLWTKHFLNRAGSRAKEALHQFGYLARDILKIDPYHHEMALRLAIQLTLDARIRVRNQNPYDYRVGSLLEEVLARTEIDKALQDKHKARDLKNRWNNALKLLMSLGWQIKFDPDTYPGWLRPGSTDPKPEDWRKIKVIDRLMQAKLTIVPPHPIPTLLAKIKEPKKTKPLEITPVNELTGDQVRQAREQKGWTRKELGGFLNLSADYVGKLERGDRMITPELEPKLKRLLHLA